MTKVITIRIPKINSNTQEIFVNQKGSNVVQFIAVDRAYADAHPDEFADGVLLRGDQALEWAIDFARRGRQIVTDDSSGIVTYQVPIGEGQTYVDTSNNGSLAVDDTEVNEDSGVFDGGNYENLFRSLTTYGNMTPNDSIVAGNFDPIDSSGAFEESDGTKTPSMMTAYGPNNADGSRQMYLISKTTANDGRNIRGTLEKINFNNDSTSVAAPLSGLQIDKTGHFKEGSPAFSARLNKGIGTVKNIINTRQNRGFYEDYIKAKKAQAAAEDKNKAYGGRLYSNGGRIQTRPAPNTIRAQNGLKLRKADGMGNDEYDVYL